MRYQTPMEAFPLTVYEFCPEKFDEDTAERTWHAAGHTAKILLSDGRAKRDDLKTALEGTTTALGDAMKKIESLEAKNKHLKENRRIVVDGGATEVASASRSEAITQEKRLIAARVAQSEGKGLHTAAAFGDSVAVEEHTSLLSFLKSKLEEEEAKESPNTDVLEKLRDDVEIAQEKLKDFKKDSGLSSVRADGEKTAEEASKTLQDANERMERNAMRKRTRGADKEVEEAHGDISKAEEQAQLAREMIENPEKFATHEEENEDKAEKKRQRYAKAKETRARNKQDKLEELERINKLADQASVFKKKVARHKAVHKRVIEVIGTTYSIRTEELKDIFRQEGEKYDME